MLELTLGSRKASWRRISLSTGSCFPKRNNEQRPGEENPGQVDCGWKAGEEGRATCQWQGWHQSLYWVYLSSPPCPWHSYPGEFPCQQCLQSVLRPTDPFSAPCCCPQSKSPPCPHPHCKLPLLPIPLAERGILSREAVTPSPAGPSCGSLSEEKLRSL